MGVRELLARVSARGDGAGYGQPGGPGGLAAAVLEVLRGICNVGWAGVAQKPTTRGCLIARQRRACMGGSLANGLPAWVARIRP